MKGTTSLPPTDSLGVMSDKKTVIEDKYHFLLEHTGKGIFEIDYRGPRITNVNDTTCELMGYSRDEFLKMNPLDLFMPESRQRLLERIQKVLAGEKINENVEYTVIKKGGERLLVMFNVLLTHEDKNGYKALIIAHDVRRLKIEEALRDYETRFRTLFERMSEGFTIHEVIYDDSGGVKGSRFVLANPASERQTGLKASEILGRTDSELFPHPEQLWTKQYDELIRTGMPFHFQAQFGPLGRWFEISAFKIDKDHFATLFFDITDRIKAQEALRQSIDREHERHMELQTILDTVPAAVLISYDRKAKTIIGNQTANNLLQVTKNTNISMGAPEELRPTNFRPYLDGKIIPFDELPIKRAALLGKPITKQEFELRFTDGHHVTLYGNAAPLKDHHGNIRGSVGAFIDITERKTAEDTLRRQAELIDLSPDAIFTRSLDGTITFWSKGAKTLYGWTRQEVLGRRTHELLRSVFPEPLEQILHQCISTGSWSGEVLNTTKDGRQLVVQSRWLTRYDEKGEVQEILVTNVDITGLKVIEMQLRQKANDLMVANKELESFSYSVAHDLRAPLRSINAFSHMLTEDHSGNLDIQGLRYLEKIQQSTVSMGELIDDILRLAKVSQLEVHFKPVNLSQIAEAIVQKMQNEEQQRKAIVHITKGLIVKGDASLLEILLENLLENAWKFTRKARQPVITFGKKILKGESVYFVKDNGAGFEQVYAEKLFKPFERLHGTEEFPGTGIGLAIAHRVIGRHGGRIWAEGEAGKGATFYFSLPT